MVDTNQYTIHNRQQKDTAMDCYDYATPFYHGDSIQRRLEQVGKKKNLFALPKLRYEILFEGLSAQIMHIGPYSVEKPTIEKLHNYIKENHYTFNGKHHEIYLGDPRKTAPEKLKTIIRQPIKK